MADLKKESKSFNAAGSADPAPARVRRVRHRGRGHQVWILLGKFFRMFIFQNDWKVFPMAALISGLLAYVIRTDFMKTMEGTLKGSFALTCVALWNGCFNSIQVICREREIVKREHRSGMHISSYICAHMIYQAFLCAGQTAIMLYVFSLVNIRFLGEGLITSSFQIDIAITVFLITFAADMLALLISALVHSTTGAMTVMPFLLIFQLVFSGGFFSLPSWTAPIRKITISNHGLICICAQADYNSMPMISAWNSMRRMRDTEIGGDLSLDTVLGLLGESTAEHSEVIREFRDMPVNLEEIHGYQKQVPESQKTESTSQTDAPESRKTGSTGQTEAHESRKTEPTAQTEARESQKTESTGQTEAHESQKTESTAQTETQKSQKEDRDVQKGEAAQSSELTMGDVVDWAAREPDLEQLRSRNYHGSVTLGEIIDIFGENEVKAAITERSSQAGYDSRYEHSFENIVECWAILGAFAILYALLALAALEFIDKDKR